MRCLCDSERVGGSAAILGRIPAEVAGQVALLGVSAVRGRLEDKRRRPRGGQDGGYSTEDELAVDPTM
ncbi:hypothetical protein ADL05_01800 [Nocardiopsis sp. NRRL B-16309]|nr:hypothetical protein ADL05_01800 [Nocardiopsis sp. NRRL B-16309]